MEKSVYPKCPIPGCKSSQGTKLYLGRLKGKFDYACEACFKAAKKPAVRELPVPGHS